MSNEEFSNEFDTLVQTLNPNLTFDEYEKSLFLTNALEQLVIKVYTGRGNLDGFELTEEARRYLFPLVDNRNYTPVKSSGDKSLGTDSYFVTLDKDVMFILLEQATLTDDTLGCKNNSVVEVSPIDHNSFHTTILNPFRNANSHRVLRMDSNLGLSVIELISKYNISNYQIRFLTKPSPIILSDLGELSIDGVSTKTECLLNPLLHRFIIQDAVRIALLSVTAKKD